MFIKFADGTTLEVDSIRGQQEHAQGMVRDVLSFTVSPEEATLDELVKIFTDKTKTKEISEVDDKGEVLHIIGQNYTIYLNAMNQRQETPTHGEFGGVETTNVNMVKLAQITYQEHLLEQILSGR